MKVRKPKGKSSTKSTAGKRINKRGSAQEINEESIPNIDGKGARKRNKKGQSRPEETPCRTSVEAYQNGSANKRVAQTSDRAARARKRNKRSSEGKVPFHAKNSEDNEKNWDSVGTIREGGIKKKARSNKDVSSRIENLRRGGLLDEVEVLRADDENIDLKNMKLAVRRRSLPKRRSSSITNRNGSSISDDQLAETRSKVINMRDPFDMLRLAGRISNSERFLEYSTIDLHGLDVKHAKICVELCVVKHKKGNLTIIVGKGIHSSSGPVIGPAVAQFLTENKIENHIDPENSGRLKAYVDPRRKYFQ